MAKSHLINQILREEIVDAKVFEIIADLSRCVDELTVDEYMFINKKYESIFGIGFKKDNLNDLFIYVRSFKKPIANKLHFYELIEEENKRRKDDFIFLPKITYNEEKIIFI